MTQETQQANPGQQEVTLVVTVDAVNLILGSLGKQPFEAVADVIVSVRTQAIAQLQPTAEAPITEHEGAAE